MAGAGTPFRAAGWLALAASVAAGCGSQEPQRPFAPTDPAGALFAPDHVIEVALELPPADWDALRRQTRDWWDVAAADDKACLLRPFSKPFDWFTASVTVDGVRRERVAVRKKGFLGSLNDERPALKLRFDALVEDQTLHGLKRLTLNNSVQDPTWLRQCLAYRVFEAAGVPVPWCNFAHVTANGRDLGLYVNVESMDRHWVRRHFERDDGELWEGEWSDFAAPWLATFERKGDVEDGDQAQVDRSSLARVASAAGGTTYAGMRAQLAQAIELDEFLRFWASEKVLEHWDGYANNLNNFLLYRDPARERFVFIPSGTDQVTVPDPFSETKPPVSVYSTGLLANRLYAAPEGRQEYAAALRDVLERAFREGELIAEVDRMQALVTPVLARSGYDTAAHATAVESLRAWIRGRRGVLLADLQNGPPEWRQPLKQSFCVDLAGSLEGAFGTSFGTNTAPDIFRAGSGALAGQYRRAPLRVRRVGSQAGYDRNAQQEPWPVVDLSAEAADGTYYNVWIGVNPQQWKPGTAGAFDGVYAWGGVGRWNPQTWQWTYLGGFVGGRVELDAAGLTPGAPVSGRFQGRVIQW